GLFVKESTFRASPVEFAVSPDRYFDHLHRIKDSVNIPVITSLNGKTLGGWLDYARAMQEAGADAIELNVFDVPMNEKLSAEDIEKEIVEMIREVRAQIRIPLAVKLSPFYTSLPHFGKRLIDSGADGLVLFNRFFESDIDMSKKEIISHMRLSESRELLLRLRWLAILSGILKDSHLAVTGGVHEPIDAVKSILCGANAVQLVASVLRNGPSYSRKMRDGLLEWMARNEVESVDAIRGSMNILRSPNPDEFGRVNYMRGLQSFRRK
ncbi:MAG: dihydroorotate dehydrogenase-like protein, partial [Thermoanaerobaculia bacterium]|nr:dihydroorotate dehydrogenase-like protein [Thermoanaerobaculia bacterium]